MAQVGSLLSNGESIKTGNDGKVALLLADETAIRLNSNSEFTLNGVAETAGWLTSISQSVKSQYKLLKGELWFRNKQRAADIDIETNHISISVRGTEFTVVAEKGRTLVNMLEGVIDANNEFGGVTAVSGDQVIAEEGKAPFKRLLLNPLDATQWTIRPPNDYNAKSIFNGVDQVNIEGERYQKTLNAWTAFSKGDYRQAFDISKTNSPKQPFIPLQRIHALSALLINKQAKAYKTITSVTNSAAAQSSDWIVRSYVEQALFKLSAAKSSASRATQLNNSNAEAWLQLATIVIGEGNHKEANRLIEKAVELSKSQDADILVARGYNQAAISQFSAAVASYQQALALEPDLASAHVGLALQQARGKNYTSALESISTAVAIEPTNASYLNYYARILYTIGRKDRALEILSRARELDPRDPGPVYVQALIERDQHRDASAIALLQEAELLNDNRGIYRSKQLLDTDRAINSADLTLAFDPFDFFAWSEYRTRYAVSYAPDNYNANLMYASTLAKRGDNPLAFSAANFRSRLLTPYDGTPLDLPNDYTSFFEQDSQKGLIQFTAGNHEKIGLGMLLFSQNSKNRVFSSLAAEVLSTSGYTGTFDQRDRNISSIIKWDPNYRTGFTLQALSIRSEQRDNFLLQNNSTINSDDRQKFNSRFNEVSLGTRHAFKPNIQWLTSLGFYRSDLSSRLITDVIDEETVANRSTRLQSSITSASQIGKLKIGFTREHSEIDYESAHLTDPESVIPTTLDPARNDASTRFKTRFQNIYLGSTLNMGQDIQIEFTALYEKARVADPTIEEKTVSNPLVPGLSPPPEQIWQVEDDNYRIGINWQTRDPRLRLSAAYIESLYTNREDRLDPFEHSSLIFLQQRPQGSLVDQSLVRFEFSEASYYAEALFSYEESRWESRDPFAFQTVTPSGIDSEITGGRVFNKNRASRARFSLNALIDPRVGLSLESSYLNSYGQFEVDRFRELQAVFPSTQALFESDSNREEHKLSATLALKNREGITVKFKHEYRDIRFTGSSSLNDRYINISDLIIEYELPNAQGLLSFAIENIAKEQFDYYEEFISGNAPTPDRQLTGSLTLNIN